jgi:hypothetical protein
MHESQIIRIIFTGSYLYFVGDRSDELGVIEFNKQINILEYIKKENVTKEGLKATIIENLIDTVENKIEEQENKKEHEQNLKLKDVFDSDNGLMRRLNTVTNSEFPLPVEGILSIDYA